ncbi:hypothetical protein N0V93_009493 [Gnomoniopsis smithogilvyi]|uniref:Uncharacterized protein n=1 Tax=Gnomoniopsis smithogilvyi TaxID=1191159 RepID=A0A9W8YJR4_9PEZI|nr:hypothetical protein N0V93_009493 [Gnomoniopsis smithogilvyi]
MLATKSTAANRPAQKLPRRPNSSKVHKRPINRNQPAYRGSNTDPVNPKSRIIYVGTRSPFMGLISKVRKALDNGPAGLHANSSSKGLPLLARIAALQTSSNSAAEKGHEVLVRGSGRAMAKTLDLAAWFQRQKRLQHQSAHHDAGDGG